MKGIYCPQCPEIITEQMLQTRGVVDASVSLLRAEVRLRYDPEIVSERELRDTLSHIGYAPCRKGAPGSNPLLNAVSGVFRKRGR